MRKLSGAELALARFATRNGGWRVGALVGLKGPDANNEDKLREVLAKLQKRHPLLRVEMTVKGRSISWEENLEYRIPLIVVEGDKYDAYFEHFKASMVTGDGIMRCVLVKNVEEQTSTFIPLIEHFAADGMSYTNLINEILLGLSGSEEFDKLEENLETSESCEHYAGLSFKGHFFKRVYTEGRLAAQLIKNHTKNKQPKKHDKDTPPLGFSMVFDKLSPDDSKKLLQLCRSHETTITGLVGAVFSEVYAQVLHESVTEGKKNKPTKYNISQSLAFDLRRLYSPMKKREDVAFHVGFGTPFILHTSSETPSNEETWEHARAYKKNLADGQEQQLAIATALMAGIGIPITLSGPRKFCDVFFTNWGLLPVKTEYGDLQVTEFIGGINTIELDFPIVIASSFNKQLGFTVQAPQRKFDRAFVENYSKRILGRIEEIIASE